MLEVDPSAMTGTVVWRYTLFPSWPHGYAEVFGDNDLLPTGNVLSVWWPNALSPSRRLQYDTQLVEVTEGKEVAWSLDVYGQHTCVADGDHECNREIQLGWKVYSAERLYAAPLAYNASLSVDGDLEFKTHSSFKTSSRSQGAWKLSDENDALLAKGGFEWKAHFRATRIRASVAAALASGQYVTLTVADNFDVAREIPIVVSEAS